MNRLILLAILLIISIIPIQAQTKSKVSLILKYSVNHETEILDRAVKLEFQAGKLISQKNLFTVDVEKTGEIGWLYLNRYVITSYWTSNESKQNDQKFFDLKTERFVDIKTIPVGEKRKPGSFRLESPDGKKIIDLDNFPRSVDSLRILIKGQKDLVINENFSATVSSSSSITPVLPILWIDSERVLTQKGNGSLVIITLDGKVSPFLELPCTKDNFPILRTTKVGAFIYNCSGNEYRIDVENKSYKRIKKDLDYDFSLDYIENDSVYYFKDIEIGRGGIDRKPIENYLALTYGKKNENGFYDSNDINTIKVWNKFTKIWQIFKFDGSHTEILGWYEQ